MYHILMTVFNKHDGNLPLVKYSSECGKFDFKIRVAIKNKTARCHSVDLAQYQLSFSHFRTRPTCTFIVVQLVFESSLPVNLTINHGESTLLFINKIHNVTNFLLYASKALCWYHKYLLK